MTTEERHKLYQEFQEAFPLETLKDMTLEQYTNLNRSDSFCYWIESRTHNLGSFWGGSSYKFGIYQYQKKPDDIRVVSDDKYAWYSRLNASTAQEAFEKIRDIVVTIATAARKGDFATIDKIKDLGDSYKWKIAFLYSNLKLVPIYKPQYLKDAAQIMGCKNISKSSTSIIQSALIAKIGFDDVFEYSDLLISKIKEKDSTRLWLYAPGEESVMWNDCQENGIMSIGWDDMGDLTSLESKDDLDAYFDEVYADADTTGTNSKLCLWEFCNVLKTGDIIYAKKGLSKIIGRGVVESDYKFDENRNTFKHIRKVKWTHFGEWDSMECLSQKLPMKTLTDMSKYDGWAERAENALLNGVIVQPDVSKNNNSEERYWWLVASPRYWSFADLKVGDEVRYTVKNENGNRRRIPANFEQAKEGDIVIGYEANPVKKIVAIAKVAKASDGEHISFLKTEQLMAPVSWFDFKDIPELQDMEFIRNPNGSFFRMSKGEYEMILDLIRQENSDADDNPLVSTVKHTPYTKDEFLGEVFMDSKAVEELISLLTQKQNVILQGAPGVGKTFSAKRLAYLMMGEKDDSCIDMVQFHQNYSYEDFIMGFKPTEKGGFELRNGTFYEFCKRAEACPDKSFFFIIDEINRGNLSKIFGELLMLIEKDYRGTSVRLAYSKELFAVPGNLYIIGMMNTADRSLAMIDYALRRRFSFYSMRPGLDTNGFKSEIAKHEDERVAKIVDIVRDLNKRIADDDSLGEGFCIGHSYFCSKFGTNWIENVVKYDLCPMLEEYWFDEREKCSTEKKRLTDALK